jgi:carbamoyltransferase
MGPYPASGLDEIRVLTIDGVGESDCTCLTTINQDPKISPCKTTLTTYPNSLGLFYSAITSFLGFEVNDAEFKVMGLASYGIPSFLDLLRSLTQTNTDAFKLNDKYFDFRLDSLSPYSPSIIELLGNPAPTSASYAEQFTTIEDVRRDPSLSRYSDIASSAQELLSSVVIKLSEEHFSDPRFPLYYSGGVALNSKLNYNLLDSHRRLYIPPDPGDGGSSLGCAVAINNTLNNDFAQFPFEWWSFIGSFLRLVSLQPFQRFKHRRELVRSRFS